jgi:hypothetical protein
MMNPLHAWPNGALSNQLTSGYTVYNINKNNQLMKLNEVINCVPSQQITMEPQGIT